MGQRESAVDLFALDDWKVTRTLRINLGGRVEVKGQPGEVDGRVSNFFPQFYVAPRAGVSTSPATSGFVLPSNFSGNAPEGFPRENSTLLNNPVQTHPEPRVGFAWQPLSSMELVLRGGYGIYANRTSFAANGLLLALNPPFALDASLNGGANVNASLENPLPNLPPSSSFPNFVGNMLPGPPFIGSSFLRTPDIIDPAFN